MKDLTTQLNQIMIERNLIPMLDYILIINHFLDIHQD